MLMYVHMFVFRISLLLVTWCYRKGCGVMIVSLWSGLWEFGWDFDTMAPPHNHFCTDSGSKWRHFRKMTATILRWLHFWLHFSIVEGSGDTASIFFFSFFFFYSLWFFDIKQHNRLLLFLKVADRKPYIQVEMAVAYFLFFLPLKI